ncbi:hypothetical protein Tco_0175877, partial [Tanacetum coccineum]
EYISRNRLDLIVSGLLRWATVSVIFWIGIQSCNPSAILLLLLFRVFDSHLSISACNSASASRHCRNMQQQQQQFSNSRAVAIGPGIRLAAKFNPNYQHPIAIRLSDTNAN